MVQLQRNPPESGEGRCRVAERKFQQVWMHEELQLWELGGFWVMETLPWCRCWAHPMAPFPRMLFGRLGLCSAEGSWGWVLFRYCAGTGWSVPDWDGFLGDSSPGEGQRLSRVPGIIPPVYPPAFIPFFPKFPALFLLTFFFALSLYFCGFFPPDVEYSSPHVHVPLLSGLSDLSYPG